MEVDNYDEVSLILRDKDIDLETLMSIMNISDNDKILEITHIINDYMFCKIGNIICKIYPLNPAYNFYITQKFYILDYNKYTNGLNSVFYLIKLRTLIKN